MRQWLSKYPASIGIAFVFVVSRLLFNAAGIYYDASMYNWAWQLLDVDLLKHRLLESTWYLHSQPPLFNLLCGAVLKISGDHFPETFHFVFLCIGLLSALMMLDIMNRLGVRTIISFPVTVIYICSPAAILYENWLFYSHLEPFLLLGVVWGATRYFKDGERNRDLRITFLAVAAICLTRSMFHIVFFGMLVGMFLIVSKKRKNVLVVSALPFALTFFWYLKNLVFFGTFSASTWFGMNFARMSYDDSTALGKIGLWQDPDLYRDAVHFSESPYPAEALTQKQKKSGSYNYNHYAYIAISQQFKKEALATLRRDSRKYKNSVYYATTVFFEPVDQIRHDFLEKNRQKIPGLNRIYNLGYISPTGFIDRKLVDLNRRLYIVILLGSLWVCLYRRKDYAIPKVISLIVFVSLYIFGVGVLFEMSENNRFRFPTISLFMILAALIIHQAILFVKENLWDKLFPRSDKNSKQTIN